MSKSGSSRESVPIDQDSETITIWVLAGCSLHELVVPHSAYLCETLDLIRQSRGSDSNVVKYLGDSDCTDAEVNFYRLEPAPLCAAFSFIDDQSTVDNVESVLRDLKKVELKKFDTVVDLFGVDPDRTKVSLYIEKYVDPDPISDLEHELIEKYGKLYHSLVITKYTGVWLSSDVEANDAGFVGRSTVIPQDVLNLRARLVAPRRYPIGSEGKEAVRSREVCETTMQDRFKKCFSPGDSIRTPSVEHPTEYSYFSHVMAFEWGVGIRGNMGRDQRPLMRSMVNGTFIYPPGASHVRHGHARLYNENTHPCRTFMKLRDTLYTHQLKGSFSYSTVGDEMSIPMVIGAVFPEDDYSEKFRLLCQAIALVRLGNELLKKPASTFVVMVVYVWSDFCAERYLVYMPTPDKNRHVDILSDAFDLRSNERGLEFLLAFDKDRLAQLKALTTAGKKFPAWSTRRVNQMLQALKDEWRPKDIQEAVDASEELRLAIKQFGLTDDLFMMIGYPFVAMVVPRTGGDMRFVLKLLREGRAGEVDMLSYLAKFESPDNHTIRPITSRVCDLGTLLLLPHAGICVSDYSDLEPHLFSVASQFLRSVAFIHQHKVAHCDLKTGNVMVNPKTGRVTLIDFDLAVRGMDSLDGFSGTEGWTAPEVGKVPRYSPLAADVWSAGKVLHAVCSDCQESPDRQFLLDLSEEMMATDPKARPTMQNVIASLTRHIQGPDGREDPTNDA